MYLFIFALSLLTSIFSYSDEVDGKESEYFNFIEKLGQFQEFEEFKPFVSPEAYVAFKSGYKSYFEVLNNEEYREEVNECLISKVNMAKSQLDDDARIGFLFLTGVSKSGENVNHTFGINKSKEGKYQIIHWHVN